MIVLFDFDSLIYKSVYRVVTMNDVRTWIGEGRTRQWMEQEIIDRGINRLTAMADNIFLEIEETGIAIDEVKYYITYMQSCKRREIAPSYKANRRKNKWVAIIRRYLIESDFAESHPEREADDLIAHQASQMNPLEYLILSLDKDLRQIQGLHFDYYRMPSKGKERNEMRGLIFVTEDEANMNFWKQVLIGDAGDNFKGIVGEKTAIEMLTGLSPDQREKAVYAAYQSKFKDTWNSVLYKKIMLVKLGMLQEF